MQYYNIIGFHRKIFHIGVKNIHNQVLNSSVPTTMVGRIRWRFFLLKYVNVNWTKNIVVKPITASVYHEYLWLFITGFTLFYPFVCVLWGISQALNAHKSQSKKARNHCCNIEQKICEVSRAEYRIHTLPSQGNVNFSMECRSRWKIPHGWIVIGPVYS